MLQYILGDQKICPWKVRKAIGRNSKGDVRARKLCGVPLNHGADNIEALIPSISPIDVAGKLPIAAPKIYYAAEI
jgi:hypothetical protein